MYKLTNVNGAFQLFQHDTTKYNMVCKVNNVQSVIEYIRKFDLRISETEVLEAEEHMLQHSHDTAEFGFNGTFTISYRS